MSRIVITGMCRTPTGNFLGTLSIFSCTDLGGFAIKEAVKRSGLRGEDIDEVIMGCVVTAGQGQNPARQAAIKGGVGVHSNCLTVNKVCGSGLKAVMLGVQALMLHDADVVVAGGMESMSNAPFLLLNGRGGFKMGDQKLKDGMIKDGLWCAFENLHMGSVAEWSAQQSNVSRQDMDKYALNSQAKAVEAAKAGKFKDEIVPLEIPQRKGAPVIFSADETPRETTLEVLSKLKPVFDPKEGRITAGNASGLSDGASAVVLMREETAKKKNLPVLAVVSGYSAAHRAPKEVFYAPIDAVKKLLKKTNKKLSDIDLIEANEAFAAQCLIDGRELAWDWEKVNVHGGAIAIGHPIGSSGCRILVTLMNALKFNKKKTGLATLCLGGGGAVAMTIEMPS